MTPTVDIAAIHAEGLWKRFGNRHVVQDVSLTMRQGDVVGFVGPNGAGKTTTIRMLLNIIEPDRGVVRVYGQQLDDTLQARKVDTNFDANGVDFGRLRPTGDDSEIWPSCAP